MSTRFTNRGMPMADSQSLQLALISSRVGEKLIVFTANQLIYRGFDGVTPSTLSFLSYLDCDTDNHASELARKLNVSRQMVAKTVKELCRWGYLEQLDSGGVRKKIRFTSKGEDLMSAARDVLLALDEKLEHTLGDNLLQTVNPMLTNIYNALETMTSTDDIV